MSKPENTKYKTITKEHKIIYHENNKDLKWDYPKHHSKNSKQHQLPHSLRPSDIKCMQLLDLFRSSHFRRLSDVNAPCVWNMHCEPTTSHHQKDSRDLHQNRQKMGFTASHRQNVLI